MKQLKAILNAETVKDTFQRAKHIFKPRKGGPLSKVLIPVQDTDGNTVSWTTEFESDKLECAILDHCHQQYRKAATSQFGHGTMQALLGFNGISKASSQILEGTLFDNCNEDCFPGVKEFVASMAMPQPLQNITLMDTEIKEEDFRKGIKGWKESTSTSPSGRHLGHYKAALQDTKLTRGYQMMTNLPVCHGFAPLWWQQAVSVMIEKDPSSPKIMRLRIFHLFEADYNLFLKLIWGSRLVWQAEDYGLFGNDMHDSCKGRSTMDLLSKKILTFDSNAPTSQYFTMTLQVVMIESSLILL